jgi:hypothetical protein
MADPARDNPQRNDIVKRNNAKTSSSVRDKFSAPNFGSRFLTVAYSSHWYWLMWLISYQEDQDVFSQNAWDHVPPPTDQQAKVADALARQRKAPVPESEKPKYNDRPARHWDIFYKHNENNFFRDRKWLHLEFPELVAATQAQVWSQLLVLANLNSWSKGRPNHHTRSWLRYAILWNVVTMLWTYILVLKALEIRCSPYLAQTWMRS